MSTMETQQEPACQTGEGVSCCGNALTDLIGANNIGIVKDTTGGQILSKDCALIIKESPLVKIFSSKSTISLNASSCSTVAGQGNMIYSGGDASLTVYGDNNIILSNNNENLTWTGHYGQCQLSNEINPAVTGYKNIVIGEGNKNLYVGGSSNNVIASHNESMRVNGGNNNIVAHRTKYLAITGFGNQISIKDTDNVAHYLMKLQDGPQASVTAGYLDQFRYINTVDGVRYNAPHYTSEGILVTPSNCEQYDLIVEYSPVLDIFYHKQATIEGSSYKLGMFDFTIEKFIQAGRGFLNVKLRDYSKSKYVYQLDDDNSSLVITGIDDGELDQLNIRASMVILTNELNSENELEFNLLYQ